MLPKESMQPVNVPNKGSTNTLLGAVGVAVGVAVGGEGGRAREWGRAAVNNFATFFRHDRHLLDCKNDLY